MQRAVAELTAEQAPVAVYAARRAAFKAVLDDAGITYANPEGAFYIFAKVPPIIKKGGGDNDTGSDKAFCDCLKKHLILSVPGSAFGAPGWARFAYCVEEKVIKNSALAFKAAVAEWNS
jgi:aspartate aminotransferase